MFSNYTDINLDIIRFLVVIKYYKTQFELQYDKKNYFTKYNNVKKQ